jgi:hypothetical protein
LNKNDTVLIQKAILTFKEYKLFVSTNFKDTINRQSGNALLNFLTAGEELENLESNRFAINSRIALTKLQIFNLIIDAKSGSMNGKDFEKYYLKERNNCIELISKLKAINHHLPLTLQEFQNNLFPVEEIIKEKNSGSLPTSIINKSSI